MRLSSMTRVVPPVWVLILLAVVLWGGGFVRRKLWEPDEARYAYVAREMSQGGHWFVPHINGKPYPDKPPLMFWLINASSLLTRGHINSVSARLPSLLGSILTLWALTRLLARWHSTEAAWRAMLILLTTFMFWHEGGWGRIDPLLCGLVMMSIYYLFSSQKGHRARREFLAYVFAGFAILAKGPVGLAIPMGVFAAGVLAGGERQKLKRWHWLWGPLVACVIPAMWLLMAWNDNPPAQYFASMFGEKSFGRVTNSIGHNRPFYYFLAHFPVELLPWTLFLPAAAASLSDRPLKRRLLSWMVFIIGMFSLFVCKRNVYILAAYPAAAMLIGAAWADFPRLSPRWKAGTAGAAIGLIWVLAVAVSAGLFVPQVPFNRLLLIPSAVVLISAGLVLIHSFRRDGLGQTWFLLFCGFFFFFQITVSAAIMPALNGLKGPVEAAEAVKARLPADQPVFLYQQQLAIFPLYADRSGREIDSLDELKQAVSQHDVAIVVLRESDWKDLQQHFAAGVAAHKFTMGHKHLIWVELGRP